MRLSVNTSSPLRVELYIDGRYHAETAVLPGEGYGETVAEIPALYGRHTVTWKFCCNDTAACIRADRLGFH